MKIYDCFQFFHEDMMLDLRLNILDKYVHKFVIVENLYMHSGKKKNQNFSINNFKKFKNKIEYILVDKLPAKLHDIDKIDESQKGNRIIDNTLRIEHNQRNRIQDGLMDASEDDLIIIGDIDEIPNFENFNFEIKKKLILFKQKMFYYKFNLKYGSKPWIGSKGCLKKNLISPQWLRDVKDRKYPLWRFDILFSKMKFNSIQYIDNGGWHFTNFKTFDELEKKLNNFGHHLEYKQSVLKSNDLKEMIKKNLAVYDYEADMRENKWSGNKKLVQASLDELPKYVLDNKNKYSEWFN